MLEFKDKYGIQYFDLFAPESLLFPLITWFDSDFINHIDGLGESWHKYTENIINIQH